MSDATPSRPDSEAATDAIASPPQTVHIRESSRLTKAAAWVGIAAGSVFIVAVIFGAGFVIGKNVGDSPHHRHGGGPEMMVRPGPPMPMGPHSGFERGPGFSGPFGQGGPMVDSPRPPGVPSGPATSAPPRP